jgi:hypothetical protein
MRYALVSCLALESDRARVRAGVNHGTLSFGSTCDFVEPCSFARLFYAHYFVTLSFLFGEKLLFVLYTYTL